MSLRSVIIAIVASLMISVADSATAESPDTANDYTRSHWYLGGGFGGAKDFLDNDVEKATLGLVDIESGWSSNVRLGRRQSGNFRGGIPMDNVDTLP